MKTWKNMKIILYRKSDATKLSPNTVNTDRRSRKNCSTWKTILKVVLHCSSSRNQELWNKPLTTYKDHLDCPPEVMSQTMHCLCELPLKNTRASALDFDGVKDTAYYSRYYRTWKETRWKSKAYSSSKSHRILEKKHVKRMCWPRI